MPTGNAQLLKQATDAMNRRDFDSLVALSDPEMQFTPLLVELEGSGSLRGHGALRSWWDDLLGAFPDWRIEIEEVREVGDLTLACARSQGQAAGSGAAVAQGFWQVTEWRDGKATWWHNFLEEADAVEAAEARRGQSSQSNLDIVRRIYEQELLDGDADGVLALAADDVEYVNPPEAIEPGTRRGREDVGAALRNIGESFDSNRHEVHRLFDFGDVVVASVTFCARSRGSGADVVQEEAHTWTFREGKIVRHEWSRDLDAALRAAERAGANG